jgi:hypothetical protein
VALIVSGEVKFVSNRDSDCVVSGTALIVDVVVRGGKDVL